MQKSSVAMIGQCSECGAIQTQDQRGMVRYVPSLGISNHLPKHVCPTCKAKQATVVPKVVDTPKEEKMKYQPEICECCNQTKTYLLAIDRGTVDIVKGISRAIGKKGENSVHLTKEVLEQGFFSSHHQVGNVARPRAHGLVAKVKGEPGYYLLTSKGAKFLRGDRIPKYAIISKVEGRQIGYFEEEKNVVAIEDFNSESDYWEGINYDIIDGKVVQRF